MKIGNRVTVVNPRPGMQLRVDLVGHTGTIIEIRNFTHTCESVYMEDGSPFSYTRVMYTVQLDEAVIDKKLLDRDGFPLEYIELMFEESELELLSVTE
jgi:hypothetical protein